MNSFATCSGLWCGYLHDFSIATNETNTQHTLLINIMPERNNTDPIINTIKKMANNNEIISKVFIIYIF